MELRSGNTDPAIGGVFFIIVVDDETYMWEDLTKYIEKPIAGEGVGKMVQVAKELASIEAH